MFDYSLKVSSISLATKMLTKLDLYIYIYIYIYIFLSKMNVDRRDFDERNMCLFDKRWWIIN